MKLKLDEKLPESLATQPTALGQEVDTARQEGLTGHPDPDIWAAAQAAVRFLVTPDLDFSDVREFQPGTHHGLLSENVEAWKGCFVVLSGHKLRVLRPTSG